MEQYGWRQPIRYLVVALVFAAIIWFVINAWPLISSLIVAGLLAYVLQPLVHLLVRYTSASRTMAVNITYILFVSILVAIPAILTPIAIRQVRGISPDLDQILHQTRDLLTQPFQVGGIDLSLDNFFSNFEELLSQTTTFVVSNAVSTLSGISTNFVWILVVLVSIYYLLKDSHLLLRSLLSLISPAYQYHAQRLISEIDSIWGRFLRGQLLLMLIVGLMTWLGTLAVGLPGALVIGLTAGILDIIPSLGPTVAAVVGVTIAFTQGSTFLPVSNMVFGLIVLLIFVFVQQIENIWIRPTLMGRQLRLHPALVFIGVFSSLALFGILAALLVIPFMASVGVVGRYLIHRSRGEDPYPKPTVDVSTALTAKSTVKKKPARPKPLAEKSIQPVKKIVSKQQGS